MTEVTEAPLPVRAGENVLERLHHVPIIDMIDRRTLALIKAQIAPRCTDAEVGHFLELCAHYQLDPFAHEAWIAKGRGDDGRLLIMVGRDGLRKIAERNNRDVQCDVVREKDEYSAEYIGNRFDAKEGEWEAHGGAPFHRIVHRREGMGTARGPIQGAWCVVTDGATSREVGWFEAPIEEYRPTNEKQLKYSPWGSQESVMILAAAERQALRQATPLSGLLAIGEDVRIAREDLSEGEGTDQPQGVALSDEIEAVIAKATELGHPGLANRAAWEMQAGRPDVEQVVRQAQFELNDMATRQVAPPEPEPPEAPPEPEPSVAQVVDDRDVPIDDADLPEPQPWSGTTDAATEAATDFSTDPEGVPEPEGQTEGSVVVQDQDEDIERVRARIMLYEEVEPATEAEREDKEQTLADLRDTYDRLSRREAADDPDQGSLL